MKKIIILMILTSFISCSKGKKNNTKNKVKTSDIELTDKETQRSAFLNDLSLLGVDSKNNKLIFNIIRDDSDILKINDLILKNLDLLSDSEFESYRKDYLPYYEWIISEIKSGDHEECQDFEDSYTVVDTKTEDLKKLFNQRNEVEENLRCLLYSKTYNEYKLFAFANKVLSNKFELINKRIEKVLKKQNDEIKTIVKDFTQYENQTVVWNINNKNINESITFNDYYWALEKLSKEWWSPLCYNDVHIENDVNEGFSFECRPRKVRISLGTVVNKSEYINQLLSAARSCLVGIKYGVYKY